MGTTKKIKKAARNPGIVINFIRRKVDESASKTFYGNVAGFRHNLIGSKKMSQGKLRLALNDSEKEIVTELKESGLYVLKSPYNKSLFDTIKSKYDKLIEDKESSFVRTEYKGKVYSRQVKSIYDYIPEMSQLLTDDIIRLIEGYYNSHFQVLHLMAWRNYHVPPEIVAESETFSDRWHCDRRNTDIFKLMILLSDVTEEDGPMHVQPIKRTSKLVKKGFGNRKKYNLSEDVMEDPKYTFKTIGPAGTGLLCNLQLCLHRASIPAPGHTRDLIQFQFIPSKEPLWDDWVKRIETKANEMRETKNPSIT